MNFYICSDAADRVAAVVAEVHNTFGEAYEYVLFKAQPLSPAAAGPVRIHRRSFMSPHSSTCPASYRLTLHEFGGGWISRSRSPAGQSGSYRPFDRGRASLCWRSLLACLLRYPLSGWLTMTRIHWEAARPLLWQAAAAGAKPEYPRRRPLLPVRE